MDILIDTHVFLWWDTRDGRLGPRTHAMLAGPDNNIHVSAASIWEIAIKAARGKLAFSGSPSAAVRANNFVDLSILAADAEQAAALDWEHHDPFDRMLIAQAVRRSLTFVTADQAALKYGLIPMQYARA